MGPGGRLRESGEEGFRDWDLGTKWLKLSGTSSQNPYSQRIIFLPASRESSNIQQGLSPCTVNLQFSISLLSDDFGFLYLFSLVYL